jgi:two-component system, NtrC family, response regulator PilR
MSQKVLIVDDEPDIRELLEITLGRMQLKTVSAASMSAARKALATHQFDFCLTDMRLPDGDGIELVREIQEKHARLPVAVITAHGSTETAVTALKAGAFDFVSKPVDLHRLRDMVQSALKLSPGDSPTPGSDNPLDSIIGNSPLILGLKQQIIKLARSQAPVFVTGESGSGKELAARAIHHLGSRKDKPFIAVNCGAIPAELMESEFFGHRKGSFTGADQDKSGLFQAAAGGTLFLDEIADLPLPMQVKLLRAIQEKAIRPVGAQVELPVDVRLLSATHKDLNAAVQTGLFRQDLYYRINVIELQVPPLRDRREDIPLLCAHILGLLRGHEQPMTITTEALSQLGSHNFPGNVRELENILQRASALAENSVIQPDDLPLLPSAQPHSALLASPLTPVGTAENPETLTSDFSLEKHLETIERELIQRTLTQTRWNRTAAAKQLGMSFRAFRYRLKKLGFD